MQHETLREAVADSPTFTVLLTAITVLLDGLTFLPVLALGPAVEQLSGRF